VEAEDVQRIASTLFKGDLGMSILGNLGHYRPKASALRV
jgi:hypothetical protein